ncbi:MAG: RsmB/NOP family class I SAM-dependent RNA methyltransferase, partial [Candidatus Thermoplasmatota archaeon]|nr:RsmB/NOP family class I SAM-dependent RNA methyltransferase [Candidatus Thermoplasmatota archaeon]
MGAKEIEWCPNGWIMPWIRGNIPPEHRKLFIALHETGRITRQEAVSMIPSLLLGIQENQIILDMCASPGSKSTHIAEILQGTGVVIANDVSKKRTNTLVANAQRISLPNIMIIQHDGRHIPKIPGSGYDAILVDAPCTGSATTRKNPDVWNKWKPSAGKRLHTLQVDLLSRAIKIASSGSVIVYSTCSLDPIENEAVISRILENEEGVELEKIDVETLNGLTYRNGLMNWTVLDDEINPIEDERFEPSKNLEIRKNLQNCIRIHQDESGHGGFFVAKIRINKQMETPTNDNCRRIPPNPNRKGVYPKPINIDELPLISEMYAPGIEHSS